MIEIYSKPNCTHCTSAKQFLRTAGIPFIEHVLGSDFTSEFLHERYPYAKTFPVVVEDGFYIGGYTQLREKFIEDARSTRKFLAEGEFNGS